MTGGPLPEGTEGKPQRQQADGTWVEAEPIPYTDTIDWEIYGKGRDRDHYEAVAYDEDVCVAVVRSRWKPLLWLRLTLKNRQVASVGGAEC